MLNKKKWVPTNNCSFHLAKGILTIAPTLELTTKNLWQAFNMADLHAEKKKIKKFDKWRWSNAPVLTDAVA